MRAQITAAFCFPMHVDEEEKIENKRAKEKRLQVILNDDHTALSRSIHRRQRDIVHQETSTHCISKFPFQLDESRPRAKVHYSTD